MRRNRILRAAGTLLVAAFAGWCLWRSAETERDVLRRGVEPGYVQAWRTAARSAKGHDVGVVCKEAGSLTPLERSCLIAANWELGPRPAVAVSRDGLDAAPEVLLAGPSLDEADRVRLASLGYRLLKENVSVSLWSRDGRPLTPGASEPRTTVREVLALGLVLAVLVWGAKRAGSLSRPSPAQFVVLLALFGFLCAMALLHPLLPPNGLGVQAGKARLLYEAGCLPAGFAADPRFAPYQPSYPPGVTALVLVFDILAGRAGDWLVQVLPAAVGTLLAWAVADGSQRRTAWLVAVTVASSPVVVRMVSGFYAEPFAALLLVLGLRRLLSAGDGRGFVVLGLAGLFRHEALIVAAFLALAVLATERRFSWKGLACAVAPGVAWQAVTRLAGAGLYDYAFADLPSGARILEASGTAFRSAVVGCADNGGLLVWGFAAIALAGLRRKLAVGLFAAGLLSAAAGCLMLGFCTSEHFAWIVRLSVPRYLWLSLFPAVSSAWRTACTKNVNVV